MAASANKAMAVCYGIGAFQSLLQRDLVALSSLMLLPLALFYGDPFAIPLYDFFVTAFGLIFAVASVTLAEAMKRIPAGETALLSAVETPLAPLFGWVFFAEVPAGTVFLGGGVILFVRIPAKLITCSGRR